MAFKCVNTFIYYDMNKPNKVYNLTIVFNENSDNIEYIEETLQLDDSNLPEEHSILMDLSNYWDEETIKLCKNIYFLAEA